MGEIEELKTLLATLSERLNAQTDEVDKTSKSLKYRIETLKQSLQETQNELDK